MMSQAASCRNIESRQHVLVNPRYLRSRPFTGLGFFAQLWTRIDPRSTRTRQAGHKNDHHRIVLSPAGRGLKHSIGEAATNGSRRQGDTCMTHLPSSGSKSPAKLLDFRSLTLNPVQSRFGPVIFNQTREWQCASYWTGPTRERRGLPVGSRRTAKLPDGVIRPEPNQFLPWTRLSRLKI
jgi:hypothetical protein